MNNPENGLYMAKVTGEGTSTMHADEDAVFDHQTSRLFKDRDKSRADQEEDQRKAVRQAAMKKRQLWCMVKGCLGLMGTAVLVLLTYGYGLYVAIAAVTGCLVAAFCQVAHYLEKNKGGN